MFYRDENNEWQEIILEPSGDTVPIGAITEFGGASAPTGWLFCKGQAVSRITYAELFEAIGTTYGGGDGSTTFNVPDFSSRSPMGVGTGTDGTNNETTTLGQKKGEYKHKLTVNEMPSHQHKLTIEGGGSMSASGVKWSTGTNLRQYAGDMIESVGGNQTHNTIHPVLGVNFIIKAKQAVGVVGTVSEDITDTNNDAVPTCETVKDYVDNDNKNIYSTTETVIGTWINGKPIYRKVFNFTTPSTSGDYTVGSLSNAETIIKCIGGISQGSGGLTPIPAAIDFSGTIYTTSLRVYNNEIMYKGNTAYGNTSAFAILEYTKTTD